MDEINRSLDREWYREDAKKIFDHFGSTSRGLTSSRVEKNDLKYGKNILMESKTRNVFEIFASQFKSPLVYILVAASIIVFFLKDYVDAVIIFSIVFVNAIIGTIQEGKAENTLASLKNAVKSYAVVLRDGKEKTIDDSELVPGDVILLKEGSAIPADARLVESNSLKINQSALTGESEIVNKNHDSISATNVDVADRYNMVFRGTYVVSGLAKAIVVATGFKTIIGQISRKLKEIKIDVPLKREIENISRFIVVIVSIISVVVFVYGVVSGRETLEMFLTVVALAVSAIPESLPVIVTLVLATGVWKMSQKNVLVKKMQAVESLGQAKIIALDKTGTITKNQMTIEKIFVNNRLIDVTGGGYEPYGEFKEDNKAIENVSEDKDLDLIAKTAVFTAIADLKYSEDLKDWKLLSGDPTEASLLVLGRKFGYEKETLENDFPKILEIPFNFENKHHTTVNKIGRKNVMFSAGSPETILEKCTSIWENHKTRKITKNDLSELENVIKRFSTGGYRVLALAINLKPPTSISDNVLPHLSFLGFVAIQDTIRPEVYDAVKQARDAQMRVVMITGDHVDTAKSIAQKVGIFSEGDIVISGKEIDELEESAFLSKLDKVTVFARVTPDHKLKIIESFKKRGEIIAMTGDGINDALSLSAADLGVSMGKMGTEVAREASDIVLLDDNFGNIIEASKEGRNIYWTIKKTLLYLLSTNLGEMLVIVVAIFMNMPLPLLATQIIWLNLVTETFVIVPLVVDPREKNIMSKHYMRPSKNILDRIMITRIVTIGLLMSLVTLALFSEYSDRGNIVKAWTISLTMLTVFQWYNIFNIRSHAKTIFSRDSFNNLYLILGLVIAIGLHLFAIYHPVMQKILKTTGLSFGEWGIILLLGLTIVVVEEIRKYIYRAEYKVGLFN